MRRLAHELNGLLDGSMRSVRLAERALKSVGDAEGESVEEAQHRLQAAHRAMADMAEVLSRVMTVPNPGAELPGMSRTIGEAVEQVRSSLGPLAEQWNVDLKVELAAEAADLPAGPIQSVLANGVRNAIQSCAAEGLTTRCVSLNVALHPNGTELTALVSDTGCGLQRAPVEGCSDKPDGHGLGLGVCRQIVDQLGGRMQLTNAPFGRGAVFEVIIPLASLKEA